MTRTIRFDQASEDSRQKWLASFKLPDEVGMEMRLLAYASEPVLAAARVAGEANVKAESAYLSWKGLIEEARQSAPEAPIRDQAVAAQQVMKPAVDEATRADEALLDAIRADLHSRPSQMTVPPAATSNAPEATLRQHHRNRLAVRAAVRVPARRALAVGSQPDADQRAPRRAEDASRRVQARRWSWCRSSGRP